MAKMVWKPNIIEKNVLNPLQQRLVAIGFGIEADAKRYAVVDLGRMRASVSTNWTASGMAEGKIEGKAQAGDGIGNPGGTILTVFMGGKFKVVVGTNVFYAPYIEFGTSRNANYPFLRPAFENWRARINKLLGSK